MDWAHVTTLLTPSPQIKRKFMTKLGMSGSRKLHVWKFLKYIYIHNVYLVAHNKLQM